MFIEVIGYKRVLLRAMCMLAFPINNLFLDLQEKKVWLKNNKNIPATVKIKLQVYFTFLRVRQRQKPVLV